MESHVISLHGGFALLSSDSVQSTRMYRCKVVVDRACILQVLSLSKLSACMDGFGVTGNEGGKFLVGAGV